MGKFINVYDWDRLILKPEVDNILQSRLVFCLGPLPCAASLLGTGNETANLKRVGNGSLVCMQSQGCSGLYILGVRLLCAESIANSTAFTGPLEIEGAVLKLNHSSLLGCYSQTDGGSIRAYGGAIVQVS